LGQGRYYVVVKPFGTNLKEEEELLEVFDQSVSGGIFYMEVRLRPDTRFDPTEVQLTGTVFAQSVPDSARRLHKVGVEKLNTGDFSGQQDLDSAIREFPTYFDALSFLGRYLVSQGKYEEGFPYLLKAIDVNKRCPECFYSLGYAFYKLDQVAAGLKATAAALVLVPASSDVNFLHGLLLRLNHEYDAAEKALLKAKTGSDKPNPEVYWQLALVYNRLNRNEDAAGELEEYMKAKPDMDSAEKQKVRELIGKLRKPKATGKLSINLKNLQNTE
jgi:tetratricopeptide (TPR) repeat protein